MRIKVQRFHRMPQTPLQHGLTVPCPQVVSSDSAPRNASCILTRCTLRSQNQNKRYAHFTAWYHVLRKVAYGSQISQVVSGIVTFNNAKCSNIDKTRKTTDGKLYLPYGAKTRLLMRSWQALHEST